MAAVLTVGFHICPVLQYFPYTWLDALWGTYPMVYPYPIVYQTGHHVCMYPMEHPIGYDRVWGGPWSILWKVLEITCGSRKSCGWKPPPPYIVVTPMSGGFQAGDDSDPSPDLPPCYTLRLRFLRAFSTLVQSCGIIQYVRALPCEVLHVPVACHTIPWGNRMKNPARHFIPRGVPWNTRTPLNTACDTAYHVLPHDTRRESHRTPRGK